MGQITCGRSRRHNAQAQTEDAIVVGVNQFQIEADEAIPTLTSDRMMERHQIETAAHGTENLLPRILAAVENHATVGEISNRQRKVWGEYHESVTV